jgi:hypothetical protein
MRTSRKLKESALIRSQLLLLRRTPSGPPGQSLEAPRGMLHIVSSMM